MENKQLTSKKLLSIHEERLIREFDYGLTAHSSSRPLTKPLLLDLEIQKKIPSQRQVSQRVLVSIKPRAPPIKTLYITEKSRFHCKKRTDKSGSRLAIGDHSSFTSDLSQSDVHVTGLSKNQENSKFYKDREKSPSKELSEPSRNLKNGNSECKVRDLNDNSHEKCFIFTNIGLNMNDNSTNVRDTRCVGPNKVDFATSIVTYTSCQDSTQLLPTAISKLNKRLDHLERKVLRQDMVIRSFSPNLHLSSSDEETKESMMRSNSASGRPGCSYIQQYSHIPETSAFQRYAHQTPLSPSKATTLEKEHNSEQYGRDFTTYDGITARGRRQCASVPCKRDDAPRLAAERVHKIRHKLNPVRDYRLMDTVHYLAQGEFAPRDDGIKLTPSREAVLSDIIYEDVCRTHWPNTRLGRRQHPERCSERCTTRGELQRLIDSLLRERVAHVERRKRRHYRIVKLNHRHENCRPAVGKTGDIIVASHKNRQTSEDMIANDQNRGSEIVSDKRRLDESSHKYPKSHDKLGTSDLHHKNRIRIDECSPGPSNTVRSTSNREPTCCYRTSNATKSDKHYDEPCNDMCFHKESSSKPQVKNPRLIIKKEAVRRGHSSREESNLEHYVLLPTLVVRTPSNMKRQKKFNELYHRILSNAQYSSTHSEVDGSSNPDPNKKDIGFNIHITLSNSTEAIQN